MTTLVESLAQVGVTKRDGEDIILVTIGSNGTASHFTARSYKPDSLVADDTYIATGRFAAGSVDLYSGRSVSNLRSIWTLPFDCDLKDYLDATPAEIHALSDAELDDLLGSLRSVAIETFRALGLAPSRIVRTGYGLAFFLDIDEADQAQVEQLRAIHKRLVARVNNEAGFTLADKQVTDAGTRIMRLPGSANTKGPRPRIAETIHEGGPVYTVEQLEAVAGNWQDAKVRLEIPDPAPVMSPMSIATADDVARLIAPYWRDGSRHGMALAVAGMLAKAGAAESEILSVLLPNAHARDHGGRDMQKVAKTTVERARYGAQVAGYQALAAYVPAGVLDDVDKAVRELWKANNPLSQSSAPQITFSGGARPVKPSVFTPPTERFRVEFSSLPEEAMYGAIGEYVDLMTPTTEAPPQFHFGAFIAVVGALAGRTVYSPYADWELFANQYVTLIGTTGTTRKTTAISRAKKTLSVLDQIGVAEGGVNAIPTGVQRDLKIIRSVESEAALIKNMRDARSVLMVMPELSSLLSKANRKGTETLLDAIIDAWDAPDSMQNNSLGNPIEAINPTLSILATTQPDRLRADMSSRAVKSGFANRWLMVPGASTGPNADPPRPDRALRDALIRNIARRLDDIRQVNRDRPYEVALSAECAPVWKAFYEANWHQANSDPDLDEMITRYPTIVRKLALVYAITEDSRSITPRIELPHLKAAISAIDWSAEEVKKIIGDWGATDEARIENRVTASLIKNAKPMTRRQLYQNTYIKGLPASQWKRVFDALIFAGKIIEGRDEASGQTMVGLPEHASEAAA